MTARQMLIEALNGALYRPIVDGAKLREELIKRGRIQPGGRWEYMPGPNGNGREARLAWITTATS